MEPAKHVYRRTVDLREHNSLSLIARKIKPGSLVLELGVATGYFTRFMRESLACEVDAVELDPGMAEEARPYCRTLIVGDLDQLDLAQCFPLASYDYIVCADVLEHLRTPERLLRQIGKLLSPGGRILASVPNAAHAGLIMALMAGDFPYRHEGLLDQTHLRFFTRRSLVRLIEAAKLSVRGVDAVVLPLARTEFAEFSSQLPESTVAELLARPDAETYQFVVELAGSEETQAMDRPIDIVVPVFRGLDETRRCLESVLSAACSVPAEVVVVDDASPEPEISAYVAQLASMGRVTLLTNETNQGFVCSVNRGMQLHPERDVVLLNSDTVVFGDWLRRLHTAAYQRADTGSVTPFTNNGTICSYPRFFESNDLAPEDGQGIDAICAEQNRGVTVDLPTAVGFCMYIRRDCLDRAGYFDADTFGRGYGEETDFSRRSRMLGFRHVLAADVFVYHRGRVSFGPGAKALEDAAQQKMLARHPDYSMAVSAFRERDPARLARRRVDMARLAQASLPRLLIADRGRHAGNWLELRDLPCEVLLLSAAGEGCSSLRWLREGEEFEAWLPWELEKGFLVCLIEALGVAGVLWADRESMGRWPMLAQLPSVKQALYADLPNGIRDYAADLPSRHGDVAALAALPMNLYYDPGREGLAGRDGQRMVGELEAKLAASEKLRRELEIRLDATETGLREAERLAFERMHLLTQAQAGLEAASRLAVERMDLLAKTQAGLDEAARLAVERLDELDRLNAELDATRLRLDNTQRQLDHDRLQLEKMRSSRSWRYTRWLRHGNG